MGDHNPVARPFEVGADREQRCAGPDRKRGRARRKRGSLPEELHLDTTALQVTVGEQRHGLVLGERGLELRITSMLPVARTISIPKAARI